MSRGGGVARWWQARRVGQVAADEPWDLPPRVAQAVGVNPTARRDNARYGLPCDSYHFFHSACAFALAASSAPGGGPKSFSVRLFNPARAAGTTKSDLSVIRSIRSETCWRSSFIAHARH